MIIRVNIICVLFMSVKLLRVVAFGSESETEDDLDESGSTSGTRKGTREARRKIVVTTLLDPPYMSLKKDGAFLAGNDRFEGYLADMLSRLAVGLDFDYEIRLSRDGKYGTQDVNGEWDGMIGEVLRGEADIAAGCLTITHARREALQFTEPFMTFRSTALIRKPKRMKQRLKTVKQLLQSSLNYGVIENSITSDSFSHSGNATYRRMWARMATFWPPAFVQSVQEGVERARREKFAFIVDAPTAEYIASRQPCEFYTLEPFLDVRHYAFGMRKTDDAKPSIEAALRRIMNTREMQQMYLKWWRGECHQRSRPTARPRKVRTDTESMSTTEANPWGYATASDLTGKSASIKIHGSYICVYVNILATVYIYLTRQKQ